MRISIGLVALALAGSIALADQRFYRSVIIPLPTLSGQGNDFSEAAG